MSPEKSKTVYTKTVIQMTTKFLIINHEGQRQCDIFNGLKIKNCQPKILCPAKYTSGMKVI